MGDAAGAGQGAPKPETILLPVDDTPATDAIVDWAIAHCKSTQNLVYVLHVMPLNKAAAAMASSTEPTVLEIGQPNPNVTKFLMRRVTERLAAAGIRFQVKVVEYKSCRQNGTSAVGEAICNHADAIKADLLVLCKHQRGKIAQIFIGSVTKYVMENKHRSGWELVTL